MITRTMLLAFAFLAAGCGKSACDELADCLGSENDGSVDEDACEALLETAKDTDQCD